MELAGLSVPPLLKRGHHHHDKGPIQMTEISIPETHETLVRQQAQLILEKRMAQMFPLGTPELPLPEGMCCFHADHGVFHYNPKLVSRADLETAIVLRQENLILNLGLYSKAEVINHCAPGDPEQCIVERYPDGVELRCTVTCAFTLPEQMHYFESTKEPDTTITIEPAATVLASRTASPSASPSGSTSPPPGRSECSPSPAEAPPPASAGPEASAE